MSEEHLKKGVLFYNDGLLDEAIREWREAIRINPDLADAHTNLGVALDDKGLLDEAIKEYREAIRINPDNAIAHYNLGLALRCKGDLGAVDAFQNFIRFAPPQYAQYVELACQFIREPKGGGR